MVFIFLESKHLLGRQAHSKDRPLLVCLLLLLFSIQIDCTRQATKFITSQEHEELQLLEEVFIKMMAPVHLPVHEGYIESKPRLRSENEALEN